ncbi:MAG: glycosyltransferase family 39 protein [Antricoccus sp.]
MTVAATTFPQHSGPDPTIASSPQVGRAHEPQWTRWALGALLACTAALYLTRIDISGFANYYYSAAAQAGSVSWKAFFFGSLDGGNSITVDKPPAALWLMSLSIRAFGLSSWSILIPQALIGVATVALLFATVRRWNGPVAGLLAATALALTPVAALMFRYNNPDALLTLLCVAAAYATTRAIETNLARWAYLIGALLGLAFLTKLLQAFLVIPAFAITYLIAASPSLRYRLGYLLRALAALVLVAGSWILTVLLTPASERPWIGSTSSNNILDLTLGYNGLGRLTGAETAGSQTVSGGSGSVLRMFGGQMIVDVSWLLLAAIGTVIIGLVLRRGQERTDRARAALLMWGTWLVTCVVVFSSMSGIFHTYYAIQLAPAIAALFGIGATLLWQERGRAFVRFSGAGALIVTTALSTVAFLRNPALAQWAMWLVLVVGLIATIAWIAPLMAKQGQNGARMRRAIAFGSLLACLAGPATFTIQTASIGHQGSSLSSGPNGLGRSLTSAFKCGPLVSTLDKDADSYRWVAAASRATLPATCQLATAHPVMSVGGFYGKDGAPTLAQFSALVAQHEVHYYIERSSAIPQSKGTDSTSVEIQKWVHQHFVGVHVAGIVLYDLTPKGASS